MATERATGVVTAKRVTSMAVDVGVDLGIGDGRRRGLIAEMAMDRRGSAGKVTLGFVASGICSVSAAAMSRLSGAQATW